MKHPTFTPHEFDHRRDTMRGFERLRRYVVDVSVRRWADGLSTWFLNPFGEPFDFEAAANSLTVVSSSYLDRAIKVTLPDEYGDLLVQYHLSVCVASLVRSFRANEEREREGEQNFARASLISALMTTEKSPPAKRSFWNCAPEDPDYAYWTERLGL